MPARRATFRLALAATLVVLLCSLALLSLETSLPTAATRTPSALRAAFLRAETSNDVRSSQLEPVFDRLDDDDELMTREFIGQIEGQDENYVSPMHVHLLWIGDIAKAPESRHQYTEKGYKLTVHTSAEEILEGFHPYVLKAYKLAIPNVAGYDFLKFALLYKYGGLSVDADTFPSIQASELQYPSECDVVFGKECQVGGWEKPIYRETGGPVYGFSRPFQILNWAMVAKTPRNKHIKHLMKAAMAHFFGRRDMERALIQDVSGSGLMSDYVALLHEKEGRDYPQVYRDISKFVPVQRLCLTDGFLVGGWTHHSFLNSWQ